MIKSVMVQKKVVILGGGESGVGAAILAKSKGFAVFLSDKAILQDKYRDILIREGIEFEHGGHTEARVMDADIVIKSPGIPDKAPLVAALYKKGVQVVSEIEFASWYTSAKLIGITGSNGKTTTTLLTYHILKTAGLNVGLAGNIGDSFAWQVAEKQFDYYVLEISSFQLDNIERFRPDVAVLLNITPDHLDRYNYQFQNYVNSKFNIIQNQTENDTFIYFEDSEVILDELVRRDVRSQRLPVSLKGPLPKGGFLADSLLQIILKDSTFSIPFADLPVKGPHNAINALAAILVAQAVGIDQESIREGLRTFVNAPHRLEQVAILDGVTYVNDSKATNVDSVYYALGSFEQPVVLIAGGVDKGNDYSQIEDLVRQKVKALIILTPDFEKLEKYFKGIVGQIYITQDIQEAVSQARAWAQPGDVVLLSPACASFDLFKNYEDRGEKFKQAVRQLV
ncbi:UDP-N-acetylmuramoylalanine--D-glutamate ligase [Dyadobacter sp. CECT 9275]|uniref:UDP-N-acetylmuramoylalanine--D-glutamate ligase n=1 Tax=Dyadobacter helix TaxID=2822344 RepID=A0A916JFM7_9BACT|nr:UDP-N-acetylmuramoyl-L-alanine--D-glutamate ligase [Dyadobacter sp. CECT 9275]CAG5008742.1 UDP-N-acetylmuramoylalanine--D-glutamate ligase [Dyadobacter sp. CECT 9275]